MWEWLYLIRYIILVFPVSGRYKKVWRPNLLTSLLSASMNSYLWIYPSASDKLEFWRSRVPLNFSFTMSRVYFSNCFSVSDIILLESIWLVQWYGGFTLRSYWSVRESPPHIKFVDDDIRSPTFRILPGIGHGNMARISIWWYEIQIQTRILIWRG